LHPANGASVWETGNSVSVDVANEVCKEAVNNQGYTCANLLVGGDPCCAAVTDPAPGSGGVTWALRKAAGATNCGFRISKAAGTTSLSIQSDPFPVGTVCAPVAQNVSTNSGNDVTIDLL